MKKTDRILLTGATGFLGSYIARTLLAEGYSKIRGLRRKQSSTALLGKAAGQIEWVTGDLLDYPSLEKAVTDCQAVIHAAALVSFQKKDHKRMIRVNANATASLVNLALEMNVSRFIYVSSVAALGRHKDHPVIDENSHFQFGKFDTGYGASKYLGEMEVWRGGAEGLGIGILNPALILGSGFWDSGTCKVFRHIYEGLKWYPTGCSGYVDVRDVARMSTRLLEPEIRGERFICAERTAPQKKIMDLVADALDVEKPTIKLNTAIIEVAWRLEWLKSLFSGNPPIITRESLRLSRHCFEYDNSKSLEMLGFEYTPIERTIEETAAQFREAARKNFQPNYLPLHYAKV